MARCLTYHAGRRRYRQALKSRYNGGKEAGNIGSINRRPKRRAAPQRLVEPDSSSEDTDIDDSRELGADQEDWPQPLNFYGFPKQQLENDDRFYVIQELLDKRHDSQGNEEYLVRWQNYPPQYDSWEPRAELEKNSLDMINEFNRTPTEENKLEEAHCICKQPYRFEQGGMIFCDNCKTWFHFSCLKINMVEANSYAKYNCQRCRDLDASLKNVIKHDKVDLLYGRTEIVDIEQAKAPTEEEPFLI